MPDLTPTPTPTPAGFWLRAAAESVDAVMETVGADQAGSGQMGCRRDRAGLVTVAAGGVAGLAKPGRQRYGQGWGDGGTG